MNSETEAAVVRDLKDRQMDARTKKNRYVTGSALYAFFEGQEHAFRDLAVQIRMGEYTPIQEKTTA